MATHGPSDPVRTFAPACDSFFHINRVPRTVTLKEFENRNPASVSKTWTLHWFQERKLYSNSKRRTLLELQEREFHMNSKEGISTRVQNAETTRVSRLRILLEFQEWKLYTSSRENSTQSSRRTLHEFQVENCTRLPRSLTLLEFYEQESYTSFKNGNCTQVSRLWIPHEFQVRGLYLNSMIEISIRVPRTETRRRAVS